MRSSEGSSTRVHAASLGEYAPARAVREGRVEVVLVSEAGRREHYGRLVERRHAGGYLVQLTEDVARALWWVIAVRVEPPRQVLLGFRRGRRADARHVFCCLTEDELDQGSEHQLPDASHALLRRTRRRARRGR